jgi:hypothetical protein
MQENRLFGNIKTYARCSVEQSISESSLYLSKDKFDLSFVSPPSGCATILVRASWLIDWWQNVLPEGGETKAQPPNATHGAQSIALLTRV